MILYRFHLIQENGTFASKTSIIILLLVVMSIYENCDSKRNDCFIY